MCWPGGPSNAGPSSTPRPSARGEITSGLALLPMNRRRDALTQAVARLLGEGLGGRVLPFDRGCLQLWRTRRQAQDHRRAGRDRLRAGRSDRQGAWSTVGRNPQRRGVRWVRCQVRRSIEDVTAATSSSLCRAFRLVDAKLGQHVIPGSNTSGRSSMIFPALPLAPSCIEVYELVS